jgi:Glycosyl hydrolases family 25
MNLDGLSFVFCRATIGDGGLTVGGPGAVTNGVDARFNQFWAQAGEAGIHRGAYHFFYPNLSPSAQASLFVRTVKAAGLKPGDMLVCDSETPSGNADLATLAFCNDAAALAGGQHPVLVYTDEDVGQHLLKTAAAFGELWFAHPDTAAPPPSMIAPWKRWRFWQWGTSGGVDANAFNGSAADLDTWIASYTGGNVALTDADAALVADAVWNKAYKEFVDENGDGIRAVQPCSYYLVDIHKYIVGLAKTPVTVDEAAIAKLVIDAIAAAGLTISADEENRIAAAAAAQTAALFGKDLTPPAP